MVILLKQGRFIAKCKQYSKYLKKHPKNNYDIFFLKLSRRSGKIKQKYIGYVDLMEENIDSYFYYWLLNDSGVNYHDLRKLINLCKEELSPSWGIQPKTTRPPILPSYGGFHEDKRLSKKFVIINLEDREKKEQQIKEEKIRIKELVNWCLLYFSKLDIEFEKEWDEIYRNDFLERNKKNIQKINRFFELNKRNFKKVTKGC